MATTARLSARRLELRSARNDAVFKIAPQRDRQAARHRRDADAPQARAAPGEPRVEPLTQRTLRLVPQPVPANSTSSARTRWLPVLLIPCST